MRSIHERAYKSARPKRVVAHHVAKLFIQPDAATKVPPKLSAKPLKSILVSKSRLQRRQESIDKVEKYLSTSCLDLPQVTSLQETPSHRTVDNNMPQPFNRDEVKRSLERGQALRSPWRPVLTTSASSTTSSSASSAFSSLPKQLLRGYTDHCDQMTRSLPEVECQQVFGVNKRRPEVLSAVSTSASVQRRPNADVTSAPNIHSLPRRLNADAKAAPNTRDVQQRPSSDVMTSLNTRSRQRRLSGDVTATPNTRSLQRRQTAVRRGARREMISPDIEFLNRRLSEPTLDEKLGAPNSGDNDVTDNLSDDVVNRLKRMLTRAQTQKMLRTAARSAPPTDVSAESTGATHNRRNSVTFAEQVLDADVKRQRRKSMSQLELGDRRASASAAASDTVEPCGANKPDAAISKEKNTNQSNNYLVRDKAASEQNDAAVVADVDARARCRRRRKSASDLPAIPPKAIKTLGLDELPKPEPKRHFKASDVIPRLARVGRAKSVDMAPAHYEDQYGYHMTGCDVKNLKMTQSVHGMMTQFPFPTEHVRFDLEWYLSLVDEKKRRKSRARRLATLAVRTLRKQHARFMTMSADAIYNWRLVSSSAGGECFLE